jgi:hypothetical protein
VVGAAALCWVLTAVVAYGVSRQQRERFVVSILRASESGRDDPDARKGRRLFSVEVPPEGTGTPVGYLLKIRGGTQPIDLFCVHVRDGSSHDPPLAYFTHHRIRPGREQFFFLNVVSGSYLGDDRPYTAWVSVREGAEILSARRVDLSSWDIGLPLSFVFDRDDHQAGSPRIDGVWLDPTGPMVATEIFTPSLVMEEALRKRRP